MGAVLVEATTIEVRPAENLNLQTRVTKSHSATSLRVSLGCQVVNALERHYRATGRASVVVTISLQSTAVGIPTM